MNIFRFDGEDLLQVGGTAMRTRIAPSVANFVMGDFKEKFVYPYKHKADVMTFSEFF